MKRQMKKIYVQKVNMMFMYKCGVTQRVTR